MKLGNTFYAKNRKEWHSWLAENHTKEKEVWLIYCRKDSGRPRVPYNDAVEEALRFGWIDSTTKKIDREQFAQRFTPRRKTSGLSQMNKERVRKLIAKKMMTQAGLKAIAHVFDPKKDDAADFSINPDILKHLKANKDAWKNFQIFPESYKRIRIAFIQSRRRHGQEMYEKSLAYFIKMTAKNKRFGFVKE
jgi:uncharacterized protein YdeI (YjbR/CyaY-like superfamily)